VQRPIKAGDRFGEMVRDHILAVAKRVKKAAELDRNAAAESRKASELHETAQSGRRRENAVKNSRI